MFILVNFHVSFQCFIVNIFSQREKLRLSETLRVSTHSLPLVSELPEVVKPTICSSHTEAFQLVFPEDIFVWISFPLTLILEFQAWCPDPFDACSVIHGTLFNIFCLPPFIFSSLEMATFSSLKVTHSPVYAFPHIVKSILNSRYIFFQL